MKKCLILLAIAVCAAAPVFAQQSQSLADSLQDGQFVEVRNAAPDPASNLASGKVKQRVSRDVIDRPNMKAFTIGVGDIFFSYRGEVPSRGINVENTTNDLGLSIGIKSVENLLPFGSSAAGMGYFFSLNTFLGLSLTNATTRLNSGSGSTLTVGETQAAQSYILQPAQKSAINHVAQNISLGLNFYFDNPVMTTYLGVGAALNFMFRNFQKSNEGFALIIGAGLATELTFLFAVNKTISIPINIHVSFYPVNFDTFNSDIRYRTSSMVLSAVQLGVALTY